MAFWHFDCYNSKVYFICHNPPFVLNDISKYCNYPILRQAQWRHLYCNARPEIYLQIYAGHHNQSKSSDGRYDGKGQVSPFYTRVVSFYGANTETTCYDNPTADRRCTDVVRGHPDSIERNYTSYKC